MPHDDEAGSLLSPRVGAIRRTALIIFVRPPVAGHVKTRLARTLGDPFAVEFARLCAEHVLDDLAGLAAPHHDVTPFAFVAESQGVDALRRRHGDRFSYCVQRGAELGERMYNAFHDVFALGAEQAIIVPTDTPDLSAPLVARSARALTDRDAVVGHATDGGYYLLGLKQAHEPLFFDMPWSTAQVGAITRERLDRLGLRVAEVDTLRDIDEEADLRAWLEDAASQDHPLRPRLAEMLARTAA
jgi:hypothetical protein